MMNTMPILPPMSEGNPMPQVMRAGRDGGNQAFGSFSKTLSRTVAASKEVAVSSGSPVKGGLGRAMEMLRKLMADKGVTVDELVLSPESEADLRGFLSKAGIGKDTIDALLADLKSGDGSIRMSDLMARLANEMEHFSADAEDAAELGLEAMPFLTALLDRVQLPKEDISALMTQAQTDSGIDIESLLAGLKKIQQKASGSGFSFQESKAGDAASLMENIFPGAGGQKSKTGKPLSLDDIIQKLEAATRNHAGNIQQKGSSDTADFVAMGKKIINHATTQGEKIADQLQTAWANSGMMRVSDDLQAASQMDAVGTVKKGENPKAALVRGDIGMAKAGGPEGDAFKRIVESLGADGKKETAKESARDNTPFATTSTKASSSLLRTAEAEKPLPKPLPNYVIDQVGRQIGKNIRMGKSQMVIQIKPPQMGRVSLQLETAEQGMKIQILTEQQTTKELLMNHSTDLKAYLSEQGVRVEKVDVQVSLNFEQSMANMKDGREQSQQRRKKSSGEWREEGSNMDSAAIDGDERGHPRDGNVNLVA